MKNFFESKRQANQLLSLWVDRNVSGSLFYPASGWDSETVKTLLFVFPKLDTVHLVDTSYAGFSGVEGSFFKDYVRGCGFSLLSDSRLKADDEGGEKIVLHAGLGRKILRFIFHGKDVGEVGFSDIPDTVSVSLIKNPGESLERNPVFYEKIFNLTAVGGYVVVRQSVKPPKSLELNFLGESNSSKNIQNKISESDWAAYRKN